VTGRQDMEVVDARLETPLRAQHVAPLVRATRNIIRIQTGDAPIDINFHRYVCRMEDAVYSPRSVGLLSKDRGTVINAHPLDISLPPDGMAFGFLEKVLENKSLRLHYPRPKLQVEGSAICLYFATGSAVFLRDVVLGVFRARRLLGESLPILVPSNISERQRAFLRLAGASDTEMISVPSEGTMTVSRAFIPSRSFARDVRVKVGSSWRNLRFLMEPDDTAAFNEAIQVRYGGGPKRRLYISRDDASTRRITNERDIMARLEAFGFERLVLSDMPVEDIVSVFANAEIILSPHGSGLTNILFAPPGSQVIEIDHPRSDFVAHGLSRALGQDFQLVSRIPDEQRERFSEISQTLDPDEIVRVVRARLDGIENVS
jgi:hypothetical protein